MPTRPWYPRYPLDYLFDTQHLTFEEHGLYTLLLDRLWIDGTLPTLCTDIAKTLGRDHRKVSRIFKRLRPYFYEKDGKLYHKRIDKERVKAIEKSRKSTEAIRRRWDTDVLQGEDTDAIPIQPQSQLQSHKKKNIKKKKFEPPTQEAVEKFAIENNFSKELGTRAYQHYADGDWHDTNGNPVKNWKQKIRTNWFKNRNGEDKNNDGTHEKGKRSNAAILWDDCSKSID